MAESRDPQDDPTPEIQASEFQAPEIPSPELQTPELDLQEDNEALHTLASEPELWKAFQDLVAALSRSRREWWLDFGVRSSTMSVTPSPEGTPSYSYDEAAVHESEGPTGRGLDPGGFLVFPLDDEDEG